MNPADELVAIVDEANNVIGSARRADMRAQRLLHRSTYIVVTNSEGELYVQRRTMNKDIFPGYWDPVTGGVVLASESYEVGAVRELEEEMGIRGVELETHFDFLYEDDSSRVWGRVFSCRWNGPIVPQPEEVQGVERMTPREILNRAKREQFTPDGLLVVRRLLGAQQQL